MEDFFSFHSDDIYFHHFRDENPNPDIFTMHNHASYEIYYFISGKGKFYIEGTEYPLHAGNILIMRDSESHFIEIERGVPYERLALHFKKEFVSKIDLEGKLLKAFENRESGKRNLFTKSNFKDSSYEMMIENFMNAKKSDRQIQAISNLFALLNEIRIAFENSKNQSTTEEESLPSRIIRYINTNLSEQITLDDLCEKFFISKAQLCRIFKKTTGTTVWNYITVKRLALAKKHDSFWKQGDKDFFRLRIQRLLRILQGVQKNVWTHPNARRLKNTNTKNYHITLLFLSRLAQRLPSGFPHTQVSAKKKEHAFA